MSAEKTTDVSRQIAKYVSSIRTGHIRTKDISPKARKFFTLTPRTSLGLLVSDNRIHHPEVIDKIACASLEKSYEVYQKLVDAQADSMELDVDGTKMTFEFKTVPIFSGLIFGEGAFHVLFSPTPSTGYNRYDMQVNFREIDFEGKPKLAVIVESIHKGIGQEHHLRKKIENQKATIGKPRLREDEVEDLKSIESGNNQLREIEKKLGCSMNELAIQTAFAFARGIGADILMATDDTFVTTKNFYESVGSPKAYAPNNWVYQRNGFLPPNDGEVFWINPYPNRLDSQSTTLSDALFFYNNTNVMLPDRYRDFPKGVSRVAVENILIPIENRLLEVFKRDGRMSNLLSLLRKRIR
ncbi:MAG: hypothetical protein ACOYUB_01100 [Patescibacteria group bacterium]